MRRVTVLAFVLGNFALECDRRRFDRAPSPYPSYPSGTSSAETDRQEAFELFVRFPVLRVWASLEKVTLRQAKCPMP